MEAIKNMAIYVNDTPMVVTTLDWHAEKLKKEYQEKYPDAVVKIVIWYD